ncbi:MAG TPA: ferritin family protein [Nitrospinota bacterium]|jgi:rubrerythrin|nr:ferritin family protein [Nitrospinota bacterium]
MIDKDTAPLDALKIAFKRECETYDIYKKAAELVDAPGAREMFQFLAEEEEKHKRLIQQEMEKEIYKEM